MERQEVTLESFVKQILEDAYNDEEMRESLNKILRRYGYEVKPNPVLDVIEKKVSSIKQENERLKAELENRKRKELIEEHKRTLQKYGLSEEDMDKVIAYAKQNGIMNFETACRLYVIENKSLKPEYSYRGIIEKEQPLIEKYKGLQGKENLLKDAFDILAKIS